MVAPCLPLRYVAVLNRYRGLNITMRQFVAAVLFISASFLTAEPRCSANLAVQPSRSASNHHQVILEAYINETGPYAFLLDTGSQITIIDESLASELHLEKTTRAGIVGVSLHGEGGKYALVDSVRVGDEAKVERFYVIAFDMKDILAARYAIRGVIGGDFLSHFNETIDNKNNRVCFTQVGE